MKQIGSQTKIIATLGPAASSKIVISDLITSGVDVFRINFSHSSKEEYLRFASLIKELNKELCTNVAILADLQGPKLRVGEIENNMIQLSGETSIGKYPVETIKNMQQIIYYTEYQGNPFDKQHEPAKENSTFLADSICFNATKLAKQVGAKAIIVFTHSGYTAIRISSHRPKSQIFAFTNNKNIVQKISLVWGVMPFFLDTYNYLNEAIPEAVKILKDKQLLSDGDCVVFVGTTPLKFQGSTNMMKVGYV